MRSEASLEVLVLDLLEVDCLVERVGGGAGLGLLHIALAGELEWDWRNLLHTAAAPAAIGSVVAADADGVA